MRTQSVVIWPAAIVLLAGIASLSSGFTDDVPSKIDKMIQSYFEGGLFQGNVLVTKGEKRIFEKGITLAESMKDNKALGELKASYQNLLFEMD